MSGRAPSGWDYAMEKAIYTLVIAILSIHIVTTQAEATVWTVSKDGSADFLIIQDAIDAAESGDTIQIGPGRYTDYQTVYSGYVTVRHEYLSVIGKSIEIQGAGANSTIICPVTPDHHPWPGVQVFGLYAEDVERLVMGNLRFESMPFRAVGCAVEVGGLELSDCAFYDCGDGVLGRFPDGGYICRSSFENIEHGVSVHAPTSDFNIYDCSFIDVYKSIGLYWSPVECNIYDCTFEGGQTGIGFSDGSSGSVRDCLIQNTGGYGLYVHASGVVEFTNNTIEQDAGWGMALAGAQEVTVQNNTIGTDSGTCLFLPYPVESMTFENNHLIRGSGNYANTNDYWPYTPPTYLHLENNYWGTTDLDEIAEYIIDGHDMPGVQMFVLYDPVADAPVAVEDLSWSTVKSLFR